MDIKKSTAKLILSTLVIIFLSASATIIAQCIQIQTYKTALAEQQSKLQIGEHDGIVTAKSGGFYTIHNLSTGNTHKIRHDIYNNTGDFPIGTFIRFSYHNDDPAEYKSCNLMLFLTETTLATYGIYGEDGATTYRQTLGIE